MSLQDAVSSGSSGEGNLSESACRSLSQIREIEGGPEGLNAFLALAEPEDLEQCAEGPLTGVLVAVKDNICTVGLPTTCGSLILKGYQSPYEATAVRKLRDAGALIVGKTNLDEFGMGSSTENRLRSHFEPGRPGPCPWRELRWICGGGGCGLRPSGARV